MKKEKGFSIRNKWLKVSVWTKCGFGLGLFSLFFSLPFVFIPLLVAGMTGFWPAPIVLLFSFLSGIIGLPLSIIMFRRERSRVAKIGIILNSIALFLYVASIIIIRIL